MARPRLIDQVITARCVDPERLRIIAICKRIQHLASHILDTSICKCSNSVAAGRDMPFPLLHTDYKHQTVPVCAVTEITIIVEVIRTGLNAVIVIEILYRCDRHIHLLAFTEFIQKFGDLILFFIRKNRCRI